MRDRHSFLKKLKRFEKVRKEKAVGIDLWPDPEIGSDPLTAPDRGAQFVCDWWAPVASAI